MPTDVLKYLIFRLEVGNSLPGLNVKNTVFHGSQADSGVFTMASCQTNNDLMGSNAPNYNNNINLDGENQTE